VKGEMVKGEMVKDERALLQAEEALFFLLPKNVVHPFTGKGLK
jgi:hypothetical protein